ncbi:hypothetical protein GGR50DRAFT_617062 [Xylaria sp. CBS 124048]|nr:hypothetical protein GGR50DRAFT_617062 [Xylaria sp. CBS 124048]
MGVSASSQRGTGADAQEHIEDASSESIGDGDAGHMTQSASADALSQTSSPLNPSAIDVEDNHEASLSSANCTTLLALRPGKPKDNKTNQAPSVTWKDQYSQETLELNANMYKIFGGAGEPHKAGQSAAPQPVLGKRSHPNPEVVWQQKIAFMRQNEEVNLWDAFRVDAKQDEPQIPSRPAEQSQSEISSRPAKQHKHYQAEETLEEALQQVFPTCKWAYQIKYIESMGPFTDEENEKKDAKIERTFTDRMKANQCLDKNSSPDQVGGLENIVRRTVSMEGPLRLLKVEVELLDGQHHLMWVEQNPVNVRELNATQRKKAQSQLAPRPKVPHFIVTCELIRYNYACTDLRREETDDGNQLQDRDRQSELRVQIQKEAPQTFTMREMANECAAALFITRSKVSEQDANTGDDFWWEQNALPVHRKGLSNGGKPDGLYEAVLDTKDMSARVGCDQIVVIVHAVNDIIGPMNF